LMGDPGELEWEPAALDEGNAPLQAFPWHIPEDVEPGGAPPFDGVQADPEGQLLGVFPPAANGPPV
jgi:hypothetical protein